MLLFYSAISPRPIIPPASCFIFLVLLITSKELSGACKPASPSPDLDLDMDNQGLHALLMVPYPLLPPPSPLPRTCTHRCSMQSELMNGGTQTHRSFSSACLSFSYWMPATSLGSQTRCSSTQYADEETEPQGRADLPKVTCTSDTCSGLGPNPEPPDDRWQIQSLRISRSGLGLLSLPQAGPCQGHHQKRNHYPGNLRPRRGGGGLGVQPRGHEDDACHMRGPWCKGTQLISCQERCKL